MTVGLSNESFALKSSEAGWSSSVILTRGSETNRANVVTIEETASQPIRYRRITKLIPIAAFVIAAGLFLAPATAQQASPKKHEHSMPTSQAGGMMDHDKMMADMKATDARLEALALT